MRDLSTQMSSRARVLKEQERLASVALESLEDLRRKLHSYRAGDLWVPTGGVSKQDTEIPPIVSVLLVGFAGSGKSSLVNLMYSVFGSTGLIPFAHTSSGNGKGGRTLCLEEHNVLRSPKSGFCVFDSRGLEYERISEGLEEVADWMRSGVRHRQLCKGAAAEMEEVDAHGPEFSSRRYARRKVDCAMVVADMSEIYNSHSSGDKKPLECTRRLFNSPALRICNESPMLILTHGDELTAEQRLQARVLICESLGIPEALASYDVVCLNEHGVAAEDADPISAYAVAEAVYRALLFADRNHPPKNTFADRALAALQWLIGWIAAFFAFLARFFSQLANKHHGKLKMP